MNGHYRALFGLLCYIVGDVLGMIAVGHPTDFGFWTLIASVAFFLLVFAHAKREGRSRS